VEGFAKRLVGAKGGKSKSALAGEGTGNACEKPPKGNMEKVWI